ncbi:MAG: HNH endonuclease signature motif containing protein [Candidatus Dormibacteria bacterium]
MNAGLSRSERDKIAAWTACRAIEGFAQTEYRIDAHGNLILWSHYGSQSDYGWEIDHIRPNALGGADQAWNLRALHWRANRRLGGLLGGALRSA